MNPEVWAAVGIFVVTQIISLVVVVTSLKSDSKTLREQISDMKDELKKLAEVVIAQALHAERIRQMEERLLLSGKRVDELSYRLNRFVDKQAFSVVEKIAATDG